MKKYPLGNYGLTIVLAVLFFVSLGLQTWFGWVQFVAEQKEHGQMAQWFGPEGYIYPWGQAVFENWQSEFLQVMAFVVLTCYFIHRGSHESRDEDDDTKAQLDRIERMLRSLTEERKSAPNPAASVR